jgi:hypothetical protein
MTVLWTSTAHCQTYQCPAGSRPVGGGGGTMCQCPDGSYANYWGCRGSPQQQQPQAKVPKFDPNLRVTPQESKSLGLLKLIGEIAMSGRRGLYGSEPLSSAVESERINVAPPPGYFASWEPSKSQAAPRPPGVNSFTGRQETDFGSSRTAPSAPAFNGSLLNNAPISSMSPSNSQPSPTRAPAQTTPQPAPPGSYAACVGATTGFGPPQPDCEMGDYIYFRNGKNKMTILAASALSRCRAAFVALCSHT